VNYRTVISKHLLEYLKYQDIKVKKMGKTYMFVCPFCKEEKPSASILLPNRHFFQCWNCKKKYNLLQVARKLENYKKVSDEEVYQDIKEKLKIKINTKQDDKVLDKLLDFYNMNKFDLVPIAKESKVPVEKNWTKASHKKLSEWKEWINNDLNIGVKSGKISNITVIDVDILTKQEKKEIREGLADEKRKEEILKRKEALEKKVDDILKPFIGNKKTLKMENLGGYQLFFKYEKDIPKTYFDIENIHIDIENDGGYCLIPPSKLPNSERKFTSLIPPVNMPTKLKDFIIKKTGRKNKKSVDETLKEEIKTENFSEPLKLKNNNLEGICNNSFIKLGGILRKQLNLNQTSYALHVLNKHLLEDPMPSKDINAMIREIDKYIEFDEEALADEVLSYLRDVDEAGRREISNSVVGTDRGEDNKRVVKTLKYLIKEQKVLKKGRTYKLRNKIEWKEKLIDVGIPIDFKMPYFNDLMNFHKGDLILIGASPGVGKTSISINIIKRLVNQKIKPYYLSLEGGSRWAKTSLQLGLKEGDFFYHETSDPYDVEIEKNSITILDWVCPHSYAEFDKILKHLNDKARDKQSILIVFVQLRDNGQWLAKDLITQFPSFAVRYIYEEDSKGEYGKFVIDKIRDAKRRIKNFEIPCKYIWETKEFVRVDELDEDEKPKKGNKKK